MAAWEDRHVPIRTLPDLESALDHLRAAPPDAGTLSLVVRRPERLTRELLEEAVVDEADGVVGDNWLSRATSRAKAGGRHLDAQVTVMSSRMIELLGDTDDERALAGDQLYVDLDLSHDNLPAGTRIQVGDDVVLEVTAKPHAGCKKFLARFGEDAVAFVNSDEGRRLRLRGLNARVVHGGVVRVGDDVRRLPFSMAPSDVSGRSQTHPRG
jgi:MOSC domain-containing protein YiiM